MFLNRQRKLRMERFAIRAMEEQKQHERMENSRVECPHPVSSPALEHLCAAATEQRDAQRAN